MVLVCVIAREEGVALLGTGYAVVGRKLSAERGDATIALAANGSTVDLRREVVLAGGMRAVVLHFTKRRMKHAAASRAGQRAKEGTLRLVSARLTHAWMAGLEFDV